MWVQDVAIQGIHTVAVPTQPQPAGWLLHSLDFITPAMW